MAVVLPITYPRPDPSSHLAGLPIIGDDPAPGDPTRGWEAILQAQNWLRAFYRAQTVWQQEWVDSIFTTDNARSGGGAPEGVLRCRVRIPERPGATKVRTGVLVSQAAAQPGLVEWECLNSGDVVQVTVPAATARQWIFSDDIAVNHSQPTWAGPTAPGFARYEEVRLYTSSNVALVNCTVHAVMVQHLPVAIPGPLVKVDGHRWLDDALAASQNGPCSNMLAQWVLDNLEHFDLRQRYPRVVFNWAAVDPGSPSSMVGGPFSLERFGGLTQRVWTVVNGGTAGSLLETPRHIEANCHLGDTALAEDVRLDMVYGDPQALSGWPPPLEDASARYSPHSFSFQQLAAGGDKWKSPQIGVWPDQGDIMAPAGIKMGALDVVASASLASGSAGGLVQSVALWGF